MARKFYMKTSKRVRSSNEYKGRALYNKGNFKLEELLI